MYTSRTTRYVLIATLIAIPIWISVFLIPEKTGTLVWRVTKNGPVALWFNQSPEFARDIGNYYFNGGAYNPKRARSAYEKTLTRDPNSPMTHYQIGRLHFIEGNFTKALEEINTEIKISNNPHAFYVRGLVHGYRRMFSHAEEDFKRFVQERPLVWAGYNDLAWVLAKQGKFLEARQTILSGFAAVQETREKNPWLWASLGVAELNLKKYESAIEAFERALAMAKRITPEYFWSAYPGNDRRQAVQAYQQFLSTLYFNAGVTYENLGQPEKAKEAYRAYLATPSKPIPDQTAAVIVKIQELQ